MLRHDRIKTKRSEVFVSFHDFTGPARLVIDVPPRGP